MKNNDNLYKLFDCNNKYELIEKLKNNDKSVRDLQCFINYSTFAERGMGMQLNELNKVVQSVPTLYDSTNDFTVLWLDNKLNLIHNSSYSYDDVSNVYKDGVVVGAMSYHVIFNENLNKEKIKEVVNNLKMIGIEAVDGLYYKEKYGLVGSLKDSELNFGYMDLSYIKYNEVERNGQNKKSVINKNKGIKYSEIKEYSDFIKTYSDDMLEGLNIDKDIKEITKILISRNKYEPVESLGILVLDDKNDIVANEVVSTGTGNATFSYPRDILRHFFKHKDGKNIIVYHNHPSGISKPSDKDIILTRRIDESCKAVGVNLIDHFVIGDDITPILNNVNVNKRSLIAEMSYYRKEIEKNYEKLLNVAEKRENEIDL